MARVVGLLVLCVACLQSAQAFLGGGAAAVAGARSSSAQQASALRMGPIEVHFTVSDKKITAEGGTLLSQVAAKAGVKVRYNCKAGTCATCVLNVDGRMQKACVTKLDPFTRRVVKIKK
ncbi:hypothetical protein JKP88DRAFT_287649 [Tribonema minus]|uniref:2Fe-2S ferredoxin-type domain-containing protein n=1 Tax=Tribonema minus TaxID=303371 RepID=A0A835Z7N4_9STRA|nr:hypothetical protein JKP88DRAFT_287649 [Tribonema minus]